MTLTRGINDSPVESMTLTSGRSTSPVLGHTRSSDLRHNHMYLKYWLGEGKGQSIPLPLLHLNNQFQIATATLILGNLPVPASFSFTKNAMQCFLQCCCHAGLLPLTARARHCVLGI